MSSSFIKLPERKKNRLEDFDYSQNGWYFVTTCIKSMEELFGEIKNDEMILNHYGEIIQNQWLWLANQYDYVRLDEFVVMPNHFHGILIIENNAPCTDRSR
ncbi:TPA: hypothetical protein DF272_06840, partial [Candidatus Falkowbacteria bacterium]|nr:hypothetical protein [Candidatus Falkowbacteria bacterium]